MVKCNQLGNEMFRLPIHLAKLKKLHYWQAPIPKWAKSKQRLQVEQSLFTESGS